MQPYDVTQQKKKEIVNDNQIVFQQTDQLGKGEKKKKSERTTRITKHENKMNLVGLHA